MEGDQKVLRSDAGAHFHWAEGNKYVIEGGKSLFWLNGGAAAGMLTFIGNERTPVTHGLRAAICFFALGSVFAAVLFMTAYIAQLHYGKGDPYLPQAERWHFVGYAAAIVSVASFAVGVVVATLSL